jgi:haloalkane dehalogenase
MGIRTGFVDAGTGPPVVLVNAGLGASTIWHRLIPTLAGHGRVIAVDLVGTGSSERPQPELSDTYSIPHLRTHFDTFLQVVGVRQPVVLVVLGLASMVVFDWAAAFPGRVRAICHMESVVEPWASADVPDSFAPMLWRARGEDATRYTLYSDDHLEEASRTQAVAAVDASRAERYRRAYGQTWDRRRLQLSLLEQVPVNGAPAESHVVVARYRRWLDESTIPKLLILGEPGYLLRGVLADRARTLPNQQVGKVIGTHLLPEDSPDGVARFLGGWLRSLPD